MTKQVLIKIFGQVQGVFFRASARELAHKLNLTGLSKNAVDGTVEIIAEGEEENLQKLINWCRRGPELAKVEKVETVYRAATGKFSEFQIE